MTESICRKCVFGRRPWSEELKKQGWVGCHQSIKHSADSLLYKTDAKEAGTGWVDLRSYPESEKTNGLMTNFIFMTQFVGKCDLFEMRTR